MRYTRLRRQIESGTLIGTHGTPFAGGAEKNAEALKKRQRSVLPTEKPTERKANEDDEEMPGKGFRRGFNLVKNEDSSEYETDAEDSGDCEDEIPLAKLRRAKMDQGRSGAFHGQAVSGGSIENAIEKVARGGRFGLELPRQMPSPSVDRFCSLPTALPPFATRTSAGGHQIWESETQGLIRSRMPQAQGHDSLHSTSTMY